ncbi:hypothetical protein Tcan_01150, partial [Toxocara canis]
MGWPTKHFKFINERFCKCTQFLTTEQCTQYYGNNTDFGRIQPNFPLWPPIIQKRIRPIPRVQLFPTVINSRRWLRSSKQSQPMLGPCKLLHEFIASWSTIFSCTRPSDSAVRPK